jgi:Fe2+ transport system protein FeoA
VTDFSTLAEAAPGSALRIRAVSDEDPARLRSMDVQGLTPGARLSVDIIQTSEDVVTVRLGDDGGVRLAVRRDLAQRIYVIAEEA